MTLQFIVSSCNLHQKIMIKTYMYIQSISDILCTYYAFTIKKQVSTEKTKKVLNICKCA